MPVIATMGAMSARGFGFGVGGARMIFRASAVTAATVTTVVKPSGLTVGDLLLVINLLASSPTISTSGGSAWNTITHQPSGSGDRYAVFWKVADAADVANAITVGSNPGISSGLISACYTNVGSGVLAEKTVLNTGAPSSTTATFTGFTPSPVSRGCICVFIDEVENQTPTPPANFTVRQLVNSAGNCSADLADNTLYQGGSVTWTNASTQCKYGVLLEVT